MCTLCMACGIPDSNVHLQGQSLWGLRKRSGVMGRCLYGLLRFLATQTSLPSLSLQFDAL